MHQRHPCGGVRVSLLSVKYITPLWILQLDHLISSRSTVGSDSFRLEAVTGRHSGRYMSHCIEEKLALGSPEADPCLYDVPLWNARPGDETVSVPFMGHLPSQSCGRTSSLCWCSARGLPLPHSMADLQSCLQAAGPSWLPKGPTPLAEVQSRRQPSLSAWMKSNECALPHPASLGLGDAYLQAAGCSFPAGACTRMALLESCWSSQPSPGHQWQPYMKPATCKPGPCIAMLQEMPE